MTASDSPSAAQALGRGLRGRCPACGEGRMFRAFLKVADQCPHCGEELHHHRADDFPAYLVIVIVGHILVPIILTVETEIAVAITRPGDDARPAAAGQRRRRRYPVVWRHARLRIVEEGTCARRRECRLARRLQLFPASSPRASIAAGSATLMESTIEVGIRMVVPRSLVVS